MHDDDMVKLVTTVQLFMKGLRMAEIEDDGFAVFVNEFMDWLYKNEGYSQPFPNVQCS
jgi:hypothetical protein